MSYENEIKRLVVKKVVECKDTIMLRRNIVMPGIPIYFDVTGKSAGYADCRDFSIHFNWYYTTNYLDDMLKTTVPHEMAHLLAYKRFGASSLNPSTHSVYWRREMKEVFGLFPYVYHIYGREKIFELEKTS